MHTGSFFRGAFFSIFFGSYTPGRVGEFSLMLYMKRRHAIDGTNSIFFVMLNKVINTGVWLLFFMVGLLASWDLFAERDFSVSASLLVPALVAIGVSGIVLVFFRRKLKEVVLLSRDFVICHSRALLYNVLVTMVRCFLFFVITWFAFASLGVDPPVKGLVLATSAVMLASILPVSISGIGLREFVFLFIYPSYGIAAVTAVSAAMLIPVISLLANLLILGAVEFTKPDIAKKDSI
jgi:hypothetical protein